MKFFPLVNLRTSKETTLVFMLAVYMVGFMKSGLATAQTPADIDHLTQQWLDTERQISHVEADWLAQEPILEQRIALLRAEREQLQNILAVSHASQDDVDTRREALLAEQDELEAEQQTLAQALGGLVNRLDAMLPMLPDPLRSSWENEQALLSATPDSSEQLQVALAKLSLLAEFNERVTVHEAPMKATDGSQVMVKQLYLGIGTAWFVSADGSYSGFGQAGIEGWQWHFDNAVNTADIAEAVAIYERQQQADLVRLPVNLDSDGAINLNAAANSGSVQP